MSELSDFDGRVTTVLAHLGISDARLIGKGGEGNVYEFHDDRVVKVYRQGSESELQRLAAFQQWLAQQGFPFHTPQILEIGRVDETLFTIERCLPGATLSGRFSSLSEDQQRLALTNYYAALRLINAVELPDYAYGHMLPTEDYPGGAATWGDFLDWQLDRSLEAAGADLAQDVEAFAEKAQELRQLLHRHVDGAPKRLVHGDYFPDNVLFDDTLQVSAVLDFGAHTLAGDPRLDATSAIIFLGLEPAMRPLHFAHVMALAQEQYGDDMLPLINIYGLYYAIYFANTKLTVPDAYAECVRALNNPEHWQSARQ
ncbi:MAG TPA: aminoglycoside phosphotransferase family protein [Ktedonobacterales bacterium]|jgi:aminoglycoside phosphotransferase